jgi:hypothetical protein
MNVAISLVCVSLAALCAVLWQRQQKLRREAYIRSFILPKNAGIRRCWRYVCMEENINPHKPTRLPLLFALDSKFNIAGGFHYVADCQGARRQGVNDGGAATYCGADLGTADSSSSDSGSGCGADGDIGGSDGGDSGSSDGCGGGGCGGGGD